MAQTADDRLTLGRVLLALGLAGISAGVATIVLFVASAYLLPGVGPGVDSHVAFSAGQLGVWLLLGLLTIACWSLGLLIVGGPAWFIMHRSGLTRRFHALIVGALVAGVAGYIMGALAYAPFPVAWFIAFSLIGMMAGWIVWALAYGPNGRIEPASK